MTTFLFTLVCLGVCIGIPGGFYWFYQNEKNSKKYGPPALFDEAPNIQGSLIWNSGQTPLFGAGQTPPKDPNDGIKLVQQGDSLTGVFEGSGINGRPYQGEIYLSYRQGKLEGRYTMRSRQTDYSTQMVHGVLGKNEAHLFFGQPQKNKKYSNQLQVQINNQELRWQARRGKIQHVFLSESGHLKLSNNQLSGHVLSYREPQFIEIQVTQTNAQPELVWIATLLCCSEILRMQ